MGERIRTWFVGSIAWLGKLGRLVTWLVISLITFPALMAAVALGVYLASPTNAGSPSGSSSVVWGIWLGLAFALVVGGLSGMFLTPDRANPYEYRELMNRLDAVKAQLERLADNPRAKEAITCVPDKATVFSDRGLRWAGGHGYLSLWTRIHQVEEALFMAEDIDWLVAEANRDLLRLKGSKVPQADALTADINVAATALNPTAQQLYLGGETAGTPFAVEAARWDSLARMKLRQVRATVNSYRQSLWDGLVRARNQFVRRLVLTTFVTAIVVDLVVLRGTDKLMVLAATVLYLIGVLVGLFARLQGLTTATSAEEDFGLDSAHLLAAPILSGIAAVVGVLLVSLLKLKIGDINIGAPTVGLNESVLRATFNLGTNLGGLIIAALFGLTPELLIRYLRSQADAFSKGLSTSETWGKSPATAVP